MLVNYLILVLRHHLHRLARSDVAITTSWFFAHDCWVSTSWASLLRLMRRSQMHLSTAISLVAASLLLVQRMLVLDSVQASITRMLDSLVLRLTLSRSRTTVYACAKRRCHTCFEAMLIILGVMVMMQSFGSACINGLILRVVLTHTLFWLSGLSCLAWLCGLLWLVQLREV